MGGVEAHLDLGDLARDRHEPVLLRDLAHAAGERHVVGGDPDALAAEVGRDPDVDVGGGEGRLEVLTEEGRGCRPHGIRDEGGPGRRVGDPEPCVEALRELAPVGEPGVDDVLRAEVLHPSTMALRPTAGNLWREHAGLTRS